MSAETKILTVFTPAYNRGYCIHKCYESLCRQTCKDFVWLVVDDGSSDNTAELIKAWQTKDNGFEIRYVYKENGGMHTAHNTAYENIDTLLNTCIDSDDYMTDDAVEKIINCWSEYGSDEYAGIFALDMFDNGKIIGKELETDRFATTFSGYYQRGGRGDKKIIYRTDIVKRTPPYPVFEGEKYVCISSLYTLIDQDYLLAVLPEVICNVDYQPDGHSTGMFREYMRSPRGFAYLRKMCMPLRSSRKEMFRDCIHYVSSSIFAKDRHFLRNSPKKFATFLAIPFGIAENVYIRWKVRKN